MFANCLLWSAFISHTIEHMSGKRMSTDVFDALSTAVLPNCPRCLLEISMASFCLLSVN